jgi:hypothetical protein
VKESSQEFERQQLLRECHSLVALIGQSAYSTKLLRLAKDGLLLVAGYKAHRQTKD